MLRLLELYAGIGGAAAALGTLDLPFQGVGAVDIDRDALAVYEHNFDHPTAAKLIDTLPVAWLQSRRADLWWASPPCQPYTRRGHRRDLDDPRAATFLAFLRHLKAIRPPALAIENVVGFETSSAHTALIETLDSAGYVWRDAMLCPSELGWPNRRPRFYLVASRDERPAPLDRHPLAARPRLSELLDRPADIETLRVDPAIARRYHGAIHVVDADDPHAVTSCFTSAYGRSPVRSGSFIRLPDGGLRAFSPTEILKLLGFSARYALPVTLRRKKAWRLVGNSLAQEPVRRVLATLPQLMDRAHRNRTHREDMPC